MPWLPIALAAGATVMKVQAEREKTKQNVGLAKYNEQLERQKAEQVRVTENIKQEQRRKDLIRLTSKQKGQYAKAGVITTTGTPLRVGIESVGRAAYDSVMARHNAEVRATQHESQADVFKAKAKSIKKQGKFAVGAAIFNGAAQIASYAGTSGGESDGLPISESSPLSSQKGRQQINLSTRNFPQSDF